MALTEERFMELMGIMTEKQNRDIETKLGNKLDDVKNEMAGAIQTVAGRQDTMEKEQQSMRQQMEEMKEQMVDIKKRQEMSALLIIRQCFILVMTKKVK